MNLADRQNTISLTEDKNPGTENLFIRFKQKCCSGWVCRSINKYQLSKIFVMLFFFIFLLLLRRLTPSVLAGCRDMGLEITKIKFINHLFTVYRSTRYNIIHFIFSKHTCLFSSHYILLTHFFSLGRKTILNNWTGNMVILIKMYFFMHYTAFWLFFDIHINK